MSTSVLLRRAGVNGGIALLPNTVLLAKLLKYA